LAGEKRAGKQRPVGTIGISYDGFEPLMALVNPHPALKVSVPMNPMVDGWMGDDWFHNGAFRQQNIPYIYEQVATRDNSIKWWSGVHDDYDLYMRAGSAGELARGYGMQQIGYWNKVAAHPAYDSFWSDQAVDKILAGAAAHRTRDAGAQPVGCGRQLWSPRRLRRHQAQGRGQRQGQIGLGAVVPRTGDRRRAVRSAFCASAATPRVTFASTSCGPSSRST
jgi:hypothetical protein